MGKSREKGAGSKEDSEDKRKSSPSKSAGNK